jgi:hypothetical protein
VRILEDLGKEAGRCGTEEEARCKVKELKARKKYPVYFFKSDTTGEKDFEEFYTEKETLDMGRFRSIGVIKNGRLYEEEKLVFFTEAIGNMRRRGVWTRPELIDLFNTMLPEFRHKETGKYLDGRM